MTVKGRVRTLLEHVPGGVALARLTLGTIRVCMRYRVTGLASEGAFFMLLSLPPLVLGLFGGLGYVGAWLGPDSVDRVVESIRTYAARFLTESSITDLLVPTVDGVLRGGRPEIVSVGFLLSLWSGSRALNVFVDTISIMYGQSGARGIIHMRAFSLALYSIGIVVAVVVLPLTLLGPGIVSGWLPDPFAAVVRAAYWPILIVLSVATLTSLYHVATPRRSSWWRDLPGALLALTIWVLASSVVRSSLESSLGGPSIYGPLSAPIVLLIWLYALAIAILIGAGLNAAARALWPVALHDGAGIRLVNWARDGAGGLLARTTESDGAAPGHAGATAEPLTEPDGDVDEARRARDRQFTRRERSALADAIDKELAQGMVRPGESGEP
ncbi:membrane protein [Intrasporangium oryzae NRRL B-24470]|uniref:Membrane protein n=1 Tax=Intrasporangium oryzae NRRL B-24470 TaxID=1386089 RepID=W9G9J7_9MICO|nr:YihY/virulence factor BrkB family protein [Intrasporangium oryzae]EWT01922.1 membrane protein [Intrasporangium oryzae NRRL B-24470]